jgi:hypothetical protein
MQHQIGLQNMSKRGALALIADFVAAVYDCRSSRLSSGFGCTNNSHSSKANENVGDPDDSIRLHQGWVKFKIQLQIGLRDK